MSGVRDRSRILPRWVAGPLQGAHQAHQCRRRHLERRLVGGVKPLATRLKGLAGRFRRARQEPGAGPSAHADGDWRKPARMGFGVVVLTFGVMGGWAALARIDGAVVATGSVVVESERKAVQHLEGGILRDLLVADDTHVVAGQVLVRLESTQARAQSEIAAAAVYSAVAEEARLQAEAGGFDTIIFPDEITSSVDALARRAAADQVLQLRDRLSARRTEVAILQERIGQAQRQIQGAVAQRDSAQSQISSITEEYAKLKPLADRGVVPASRITTLDRSRTELEGRAGALIADIARLEQSIEEARLQVDQVGRRALEEVSGRLAETRGRLADSREKLRVARDVLSRTELRAMRAGRVVSLKVHTVGAVVRPGETLMEIVPEDDTLVVSARISPLDVNHVHPGLPAEVRFPSFKARTTPILVGELKSVAADAQRDDTTRQPYYEVKVSVRTSEFPEKIRASLRPGMPADVLIATGERSVLAYLAQPMLDAMRHGMREQ